MASDLKYIEKRLRAIETALGTLGVNLANSLDHVSTTPAMTCISNGVALEAILRDLWQRLGIKGQPARKHLEDLVTTIGRKLEEEGRPFPRPIFRYMRGIQITRNDAAHHLDVTEEDAVESLRHLSEIVQWYFVDFLGHQSSECASNDAEAAAVDSSTQASESGTAPGEDSDVFGVGSAKETDIDSSQEMPNAGEPTAASVEPCSSPIMEKNNAGKRDAPVLDSSAIVVTPGWCEPSIPTAPPRSVGDSALSPTPVAGLGRPLETIITSTGMKLVSIPPGEFLMGSPDSDDEALPRERPQHLVRITRFFYLGMYPVTNGQFRQFVEDSGYETEGQRAKDPTKWNDQTVCQGEDHPVAMISWHDAIQFCQWLGGTEGETYRLPTEAEWEYACRAGSGARYGFGDQRSELVEYAWFKVNSTGRPAVGQKRPNAWGLYDMHGNVTEWCADRYSDNYYSHSPPADPLGPSKGTHRLNRGGNWSWNAISCRSAHRTYGLPELRANTLGFRVALVLSGK